MHIRYALAVLALSAALPAFAETTRFCLTGEFDLGARYQGTHSRAGEMYPMTWCVITDDESERVQFSASGKSNPDMEGGWTVAYLSNGLVRIVNRDDPPDIEFRNTNSVDEARGTRRLDPRRLVEEYHSNPSRFTHIEVEFQGQNLASVETQTDLPLRGRVAVVWQWDWTNPDTPGAQLSVDGDLMFRATGQWEVLSKNEAAETWSATPGADPIDVPGDNWPSSVNMQLQELDDGVHLVTGVRSGFQHIVVETSDGLVIGDAPAGWVELHQIPPTDLVPGLGISGLSEQFIDFLKAEFEGQEIAAVGLTHFHDDHAGGARAFAAEGARIYAPAASVSFLEGAFNDDQMPKDRLSRQSMSVDVIPVSNDAITQIGNDQVRLVPIGSNPHVDAMLGVWAVGKGYFFVSDIHVPRSDADEPSSGRAETECWFARKAVAMLPNDVQIVNSHSGTITPVSRFQNYIESDICQ
jgi:glyoxylase-like metal-dependent hydrolase (beta-lactamase superfamily II)